MVDHPMDTSCTNDGELSTTPGRVPTERFSPITFLSDPRYVEMSLAVLVAGCVRELNTFRGVRYVQRAIASSCSDV